MSWEHGFHPATKLSFAPSKQEVQPQPVLHRLPWPIRNIFTLFRIRKVKSKTLPPLLQCLLNIFIGLVYCCTHRMAFSTVPFQPVNLSFTSLTDLTAFKNECNCSDFYRNRDSLTLVGSFSKEQLKIATGRYFALYYTVQK
jgi:hypothetical protein